MASLTATQTMSKAADPGQVASESRVDRDSHFNGLYQTKQNLRIEGIAEGEIECDGTVTVAEGARVKAKVTASTVTIAGELEGEVVCRDVFQIMPTGQVEATVSARRLIVHEGGFYNGEFHMITETPDLLSAGSPALDAFRPSEEKQAEPSTTGGMSSDDWWAKMSGGGHSTADPDLTSN